MWSAFLSLRRQVWDFWFFANGGIICTLGFAALAVLWMYSNYKGYSSIRKREIIAHQLWMIRNYALTFAAVTLRLWLPFLMMVIKLSFINSYRLVAWISWIPNLLIAELLIKELFSDKIR